MARRKITIKDGLDKLTRDIQRLYADGTDIIKSSVYDGAGVVADAYRESIRSIPIDNRYWVKDGDRKTGLQISQVNGLLEGMGIARFEEKSGEIQTRVGVDGYNSNVTNRWPQGQPNAMIARSLVSGTSFLRAYDFVGRARRNARTKAENTMKRKLEEEIARRMTGG